MKLARGALLLSAVTLGSAACGVSGSGNVAGSGGALGTAGSGGQSGTAGAGATGSGGATTGTGGAGATGTGGAGTTGTGGAATGTGGAGMGTGGAGPGGTAGAGAGGATGIGGTGGGYIWPNATSHTNSDPWIEQHHDQIVQMNPNVLVLNYANKCGANAAVTCDATEMQNLVAQHVQAFQQASRYRGYNDPNAAPFINYNVVKIVDLRDGTANVDSAMLPIASNGTEVDYAQLNSQAYADLIGMKDPADTSANPPNQTLCQLFEKGIINEVWGSVADHPDPAPVKFGESAESKMVYSAANVAASPAKFVTVGNGPDISPTSRDSATALPCKVTTRVWDFNPTRGSGCHLHSLGHLLENYARDAAVPAFGKVALTFFNLDFRTRFGAAFNSFYDVCPYTNDVCIAWQANGGMPDLEAMSGTASSQAFDFKDLSAGCGNVHFPANATTQYVCAGDVNVATSCENYGLHNGANGKDLTTPYTNAMAAAKYGEGTREDNGFNNFANGVASDCGAEQPTYIFASMPGFGTTATASDGTAMHNWWVYLFY